jgi:hypothetical protein
VIGAVLSIIHFIMAPNLDKDDFFFGYVEFQRDAVGNIDGYGVQTFKPAPMFFFQAKTSWPWARS